MTVISIPDAELILAGSVIREPVCIDDVAGIVQADDFASYAAGLVYQTAQQLHASNRRVDSEAVLLELIQQKKAVDLGPNPGLYLADLLDRAPTEANAVPAARMVREAAVLREADALATEFRHTARHPTGPADEVVEGLIRKLSQLIDRKAGDDEPISRAELLAQAIARYDTLGLPQGGVVVPSGFPELDQITGGGWRPREFILVGGRTSGGKTVALRQFTTAAAAAGHPVMSFSFEMSPDENMDREVADLADVPLGVLRAKERLDRRYADRVVAHQQGREGNLPIWYDRRGQLTVDQIAAATRRAVRRHGVRVITVDYVQLISPADRSARRVEQLGQISRDLKNLASALEIVVIAAAQLSRGAVGEEPELHHFRESGSLEQDANIALLISKVLPHDPTDTHHAYKIRVAKQRSGAGDAEVPLYLNRAHVRFGPR